MKTCPACGAQNPDTAIFCNACGARLDAAGPAPNPGPRYQNPDDGYPYGQGPAYGGQQGYGGIYWAYKMGQNCACLNGDSSGSILYLLLALFGFQIINLALFQDMINKCA